MSEELNETLETTEIEDSVTEAEQTTEAEVTEQPAEPEPAAAEDAAESVTVPAEEAAEPEAEAPEEAPEAEPNPAPEFTAPSGAVQAPAEAQSFFKTIWFKIIAAALAIAVVAGVALGVMLTRPANSILRAAQKTGRAIASNELVTTAADILKGGRVGAEMDVSSLAESYAGMELDASAKANIYFSKDALALDAAASYEGSEILSAAFWLSGNYAVADCDAILDDPLGADLKNLKTKLPDSVFNPENSENYGLPQEIYDSLMSNDDDITEAIEDMYQRAAAIAEDGAKRFIKSVNKNTKPDKGSDVVEFESADVKAKYYTYDLDDKEVKTILKDMKAWAEESADIKELLRLMSTDYAEICEEYLDIDPEELEDNFYDFLDDDLADFIDDIEDIDCEISFYINSSNGQLIQVAAETDYGRYEFTLGPDAKKPELIKYAQKMGDWKTSLAYEVNERSKDEYKAEVTVKSGDEAFKGSVSWDKTDGSFKVKSEELFAFKANLAKDGSDYVMDVKSLEVYGEEIELDLQLYAGQAKMPEVPGYKDILTIRDDETVDELVNGITENAQTFASELMSQVLGFSLY